jgi:hypothetical protein
LRTQENTYEEWAKLYGKNGLYEQPVTNNRWINWDLYFYQP